MFSQVKEEVEREFSSIVPIRIRGVFLKISFTNIWKLFNFFPKYFKYQWRKRCFFFPVTCKRLLNLFYLISLSRYYYVNSRQYTCFCVNQINIVPCAQLIFWKDTWEWQSSSSGDSIKCIFVCEMLQSPEGKIAMIGFFGQHTAATLSKKLNSIYCA